MCCDPWGRKESDTTEQQHASLIIRVTEEILSFTYRRISSFENTK